MPGYSATPLPKKLGIKDGQRVAFVDAPEDVLAELKAALAGCEIASRQMPGLSPAGRTKASAPTKSALDFAMIFAKSKLELEKKFWPVGQRLAPAGMLWVSWPKKSSGVATDLTDNVVREIGLEAGLVDVKVCAVTEVWSGLKFVRRVKDR